MYETLLTNRFGQQILEIQRVSLDQLSQAIHPLFVNPVVSPDGGVSQEKDPQKWLIY